MPSDGYAAAPDTYLLRCPGGKCGHKANRVPADVPAAWSAATQEQRNKLARTLFDEVVWLWHKGKGNKWPSSLDGNSTHSFRINYEESEARAIEGRRLEKGSIIP